MKKISVFGSTGSVGRQIIEVLENFYSKDYKVKTLSCKKNYKLAAKQAIELNAENIAIEDKDAFLALKKLLVGRPINVLESKDLKKDLITQNDLVLIGMSGIEALPILCTALDSNIKVATANKESIICGGQILKDKINRIIPLDSEHNAIFRLLNNIDKSQVENIILTATGGPFFKKDKTEISIKDAVQHPVWDMGQKISVDSATMMNKVFELIEAHYLFDTPKNKIEILIHPEAIIHGGLRLLDGSILSLGSNPSMKVGIDFALSQFIGQKSRFKSALDLAAAPMTFFKPCKKEFLALDFLKTDQHITLVAANDVANSAFLSRGLPYPQITKLIAKTLDKYSYKVADIKTLKDVEETYKNAKQAAKTLLTRNF